MRGLPRGNGNSNDRRANFNSAMTQFRAEQTAARNAEELRQQIALLQQAEILRQRPAIATPYTPQMAEFYAAEANRRPPSPSINTPIEARSQGINPTIVNARVQRGMTPRVTANPIEIDPDVGTFLDPGVPIYDTYGRIIPDDYPRLAVWDGDPVLFDYGYEGVRIPSRTGNGLKVKYRRTGKGMKC
jgi:hypothetical protein